MTIQPSHLVVVPATLSLLVLGSSVDTAAAHEALSGWQYPLSCCSSLDCQEVNASRVRETPNGYQVTLGPGQHLMLVETRIYNVPYESPRIRKSPDGIYHACISRQFRVEHGTEGGSLICIFVPPKGF